MASKAKALHLCKSCHCYNCNFKGDCWCPLRSNNTTKLRKGTIENCGNYKEAK